MLNHGGRVEVIKAVRVPVAAADIRAAVLATAGMPAARKRLPRGSWEVALKISGDRELRRLNRTFLGEDHVTDVLSFPAGAGEPHLGDIVISWPAARRQAEHFGHLDADELALLAVHGFLHLLGFDHAHRQGENAMNRLTVMALAESGHRIASGRLGRPGA